MTDNLEGPYSTADQPLFDRLRSYIEYPEDEMLARSREFAAEMRRRRTIRQFSNRPVPREVIEACLDAAGSAPSGANRQPWHFVVVSDPEIKRRIREAAEAEERRFYSEAPPEWLEALAPFGTDPNKPFLEIAPYLIVVFAERYITSDDGTRHPNYYVPESVGIAAGILIAALHHAGLATLTHTPNPMGFLTKILGRPSSEKPLMVVVTGFPAHDAIVPRIRKKSLAEYTSFR